MIPKGVFCLEIGDWCESLTDGTSVKPVLKLLATAPSRKAPYIHRDIITEAELVYYLKKWPMQKHSKFPILYLAMHGERGEICLKKENGRDHRINLDTLAGMLEGKCHKKIIHFGSCSTLLMHGHQVNSFLKRTGALAVSGFTKIVDWEDSTAFELIYLSAIQENALTRAGMTAVFKKLKKKVGTLYSELGFRYKMLP